MKHDQVTLQVINQIELHFSKLRVVRREVLDSIRTKHSTCLAHDGLDVDRLFFGLRSNVEAGSNNDIGVRLTIGILEVESPEEYRCGSDYTLA